MESKTYTLTLADGTAITGLKLNGSCYVAATEQDTKAFADENLKTVKVSDGTSEQTRTNLRFNSQFKGPDGYYLTFDELSAAEVTARDLNTQITELQEALAELAEA